LSNVCLVTGCAGFIGRTLVDQLLSRGHYVIGVDKGTYASRFDLLATCSDRFRLARSDVSDLTHLYGADTVFHLAAESHVDNSINDSRRFISTNVGGTHHLLELIRGQRPHDRPTFIHMSTDEVYGDVPEEWASQENDVLCPSSPYSASKAAADMLVLAWQRTYGLKARIVRASNCYGSDQYPEKLIPKTIRSWQLGKRMTIHGDGSQTRMWLHVEDCARALIKVWEMGQDGEVYNVPGDTEASVRMVVETLQGLCAEQTPGVACPMPQWGCERPGGDRRYRVDGTLLKRLGWEATRSFFVSLPEIVRAELEAGVRL
jgi:dTDP-glucose 4,6-dehydratase